MSTVKWKMQKKVENLYVNSGISHMWYHINVKFKNKDTNMVFKICIKQYISEQKPMLICFLSHISISVTTRKRNFRFRRPTSDDTKTLQVLSSTLRSSHRRHFIHISTNNALFIKMETRGKGEEWVQAFSEHDLHTQDGHGLRSLINAEND